MKLLIFKALWGMTGSLHEQVEQVAVAGYDGFELWPEQQNISRHDLVTLARSYNLKMIVGTALQSQSEIEPKLKYLSEYESVRINLHSGRDSMTHDEGCSFFEEAL